MNSIETVFRLIEPHWYAEPGATEEHIRKQEAVLQVHLPEDYRLFLKWSNGGEGQIGDLYFSPWPVNQIKDLNVGYLIPRYLPGVVGIGSSLGPLCFGFDYRFKPENPPFVSVPFGDFDFDSVVVLGETFQKALEKELL